VVTQPKKKLTKQRSRRKSETRLTLLLTPLELAKLEVIGQERGLARHLVAEDLLKDLLAQYEEKVVVVKQAVLRRRPGRQPDVVNKA